jgi:hypothetical protein
MVPEGADRVEVGDEGDGKVGREGFAIHLLREGRGEILPHGEEDEDGVARLPRGGLVVKQRELHGE